MKKWLEKLKTKVKILTKEDYSGHDYWHAIRVSETARKIGIKEKADIDVLLAAAILHDVYAAKDYATHMERASKFAERILMKIGFPKNKVSEVTTCIKNHEKYDWDKTMDLSKEAKIIQDADRIDALGAIGIARVFTFGGWYGRPMYNPNEKINLYHNFMKTKKSTVTHFYEKLLLLKDNMNTKTGKEIAEERHKFMKLYLKEFFKEWKGKA